MRKLVPIKDSAVCRKLRGGIRYETKGNFKVKVEEVDIYEIISIPETESFFHVGDIVMSNSTGDEVEINPKETVYLFKIENLMCKLDEKENI